MGKCCGNCIQCTLVPDEMKETCCGFQTLRQAVEIRGQLNKLLSKISEISSTQELPTEPIDICEAEELGNELSEIIKD